MGHDRNALQGILIDRGLPVLLLVLAFLAVPIFIAEDSYPRLIHRGFVVAGIAALVAFTLMPRYVILLPLAIAYGIFWVFGVLLLTMGLDRRTPYS